MVSKTARWAWTYARMRQLYLTVKRDPKRAEYKTLRFTPVTEDESRPHHQHQHRQAFGIALPITPLARANAAIQ